MNILWFLLGIIACFGFELIFAVILAFKEIKDRKKHFQETMEMLNEIQVKTAEEEMKPKKTSTKKTKTTTRKTTKKGE